MHRLHPLSPLFLLLVAGSLAAEEPAKLTPRKALKPFNSLIGSWRGTGEPEGTREQKQRGFWSETIQWEWQFKGDDAWLKADFEKGKYFTAAELRYLPDKNLYRMILTTPAKEKLTYEGPFKDKRLTLERTDDKTKETQRLVVSLLHSNRYLYRYEIKPAEHTAFTKVYQVGATKEGVAFASDGNEPECVVSGGLGTIQVTYMGKTYYVCCTGCRDAFKDEPEKYVKEYEERQKAKKEKEQKE
jgi:hypothetical protein